MRHMFLIASIVYLGFHSIFFGYIGNTTNTGGWSDFYVGLIVLDMVLIAACLLKNFERDFKTRLAKAERAGSTNTAEEDDDFDFRSIQVPGLYLYSVLAVLFLGTAIAAFNMNRSATGLYSTYTLLWMLSSLGLFGVAAAFAVRAKHRRDAIVAAKFRASGGSRPNYGGN